MTPHHRPPVMVEHCARREKELLSRYEASRTASNPDVVGQVREVFVRDFLRTHLTETVAIGQGEVIDCESQDVGQMRNQHDVVVYRKEYPRLHLAEDTHVFLAESVVATIEVKSTLTEAELKKAVRAARNVKKLKISRRSVIRSGYVPPAIQCHVVAYAGPTKVATVHKWLNRSYSELGLKHPEWGNTWRKRISHAAPAIDGVFILGKGNILYDNSPIWTVRDKQREGTHDGAWMAKKTPDQNLLILFLILATALSGCRLAAFDLNPYISGGIQADGTLMP